MMIDYVTFVLAFISAILFCGMIGAGILILRFIMPVIIFATIMWFMLGILK